MYSDKEKIIAEIDGEIESLKAEQAEISKKIKRLRWRKKYMQQTKTKGNSGISIAEELFNKRYSELSETERREYMRIYRQKRREEARNAAKTRNSL